MKKYVNPEKIILISGVMLFASFSILLSTFLTLESHFELFKFIRDIFIASLLSLCLLGICVFFVRYLNNNHYLKRRRQLRIFIKIVFVLTFGPLMLVIGNLFFWGKVSMYDFFINVLYSPSIIVAEMITSFTLIASEFYITNQEEKLRKKELDNMHKELLLYRYKLLKEQLNPHFLFNSLNILNSLIHQDKDKATKFTHKLSDFYRYVLKADEHELIELEHELNFVRDYTDILHIRFPEGLRVEYNISSGTETKLIPPLSIQTLVENAVKHNSIVKEYPLIIVIEAKKSYVEVRNNINPKKNNLPSTGIGINNIRMKYELITDKKIEIFQSQEVFKIIIPLL